MQCVGGLPKRQLGPQKGPCSWGSCSWAEANKVSASTRPSQPAQPLPFPPWQGHPVLMLSSSQQQNLMFLVQFWSKSQQHLPAVQKPWAGGGVLGRWASRMPVQGSPLVKMSWVQQATFAGAVARYATQKGTGIISCTIDPVPSQTTHV